MARASVFIGWGMALGAMIWASYRGGCFPADALALTGLTMLMAGLACGGGDHG